MIHHFLFQRLEYPHACPLLDHDHDLLAGDRRRRAHSHAQDAQHPVGRQAEKVGQRRHDAGQPAHHRSNAGGKAFRIVQGQALGRQFAQHQGQVGDDQDHQADADGLGVRRQE